MNATRRVALQENGECPECGNYRELNDSLGPWACTPCANNFRKNAGRLPAKKCELNCSAAQNCTFHRVLRGIARGYRLPQHIRMPD
ncbi:unnamed protein product, partial [Mesorhabditis spiculigera]